MLKSNIFNAQGSKVIIIFVQVGVVNIYNKSGGVQKKEKTR